MALEPAAQRPAGWGGEQGGLVGAATGGYGCTRRQTTPARAACVGVRLWLGQGCRTRLQPCAHGHAPFAALELVPAHEAMPLVLQGIVVWGTVSTLMDSPQLGCGAVNSSRQSASAPGSPGASEPPKPHAPHTPTAPAAMPRTPHRPGLRPASPPESPAGQTGPHPPSSPCASSRGARHTCSRPSHPLRPRPPSAPRGSRLQRWWGGEWSGASSSGPPSRGRHALPEALPYTCARGSKDGRRTAHIGRRSAHSPPPLLTRRGRVAGRWRVRVWRRRWCCIEESRRIILRTAACEPATPPLVQPHSAWHSLKATYPSWQAAGGAAAAAATDAPP